MNNEDQQFLKHVSDAFKERSLELQAAFQDPATDYCLGDDAGELMAQEPEARDDYTETNVFRVSGHYVGATAQEADAAPFEEKMARLTAALGDQFRKSARLEAAIRKNLAGLGYEV